MTVSEELGRGDRLCVNGGCGPGAVVRVLAQFVISVSRTIPDMIWRLSFVVTVGL